MRLAVLITVIVLAILMVAAAVGPFFVPTKTYQKFVEETLADRLDARVVIDGFRLRLIPYPGYTIWGLSLISKDPPFRGMPVIEAKKVIGSLSFGALFGGDLRTEVEARDVGIYLRSQDGVTNFGMILGLDDARKAGTVPAMRPPPEAAPRPDVPDAPIESIPALPAPSIDVKPDDGQRGGKNFFHNIDSVVLRDAFASNGAKAERSLTLDQLEIVRGRIEITGESGPGPMVMDDVSIAASNLSLRGGFSANLKISGTLAREGRTGVSAQGQLIVDEARRELTFRDARIHFGRTQLVSDAVIGYGMTPAFIDAHIATPNLSQAALSPILSQLGWRVPPFISWQGTLGADLSFKGTRQAGQLKLQLDASQARVILGKGFSKEPGLPFKVQSEILIKPSSFTVGRGKLSLEGSDMELSGEIVRDEQMRTKLVARGSELQLLAMRSLMPWLPDLDSVDRGSVDLALEGSLFGEGGLSVKGRLRASNIKLAGIELGDVEGSFLKEQDRVEFSTLRGKFAGGSLSGNGRVDTGPGQGLQFDVVVNDVDMKEISTLRGSVEGRGSMVAKATSEGEDRFALLKNFTVSGHFVADRAKVAGLEAAAGAFSKSTWEGVVEKTGVELSEVAGKDLEKASGEIEDLKASFEMKDDRIEIEGLSWKTGMYTSDLSADVGADGRIKVSGLISVDRAPSGKLIPDPQARKKVLDRKGRLILPVEGSGKLSDPRFSLDGEKLAALIEDRLRPKPMVEIVEKEKAEAGLRRGVVEESELKALEAPSIEMKEEVVEAPTTIVEGPKVEKKEARARAPRKKASKPRPKARRRAPARRRAQPSQPDQSVDDILKVIIGD